jgi:hypothetical protein
MNAQAGFPDNTSREAEQDLDWKRSAKKGGKGMLLFILPVFLLIALVASLPIWPHNKKWSFYPLGGVSLVIMIILFLFWTGRL